MESATQGFEGHAPVAKFVRSLRTLTHRDINTSSHLHDFLRTQKWVTFASACPRAMCNIKSLHKQPDQSNLPELMIAYLRNNNLDQVPVMQPTPYSRWSLFQISMLHPPTSHKADMFSSMKKLTRLDISRTKYEFVVVPAHMSPQPCTPNFSIGKCSLKTLPPSIGSLASLHGPCSKLGSSVK